MSLAYCAPDLPFFQTVLWYAKQIGAVVVVTFVILLVGFTGLGLWEWRRPRK